MLICGKCRKELHCEKNGVGADYGKGHIYPGDLYKCPICKIEILSTTLRAIYDPKHLTQETYIEVKL